MSATVTSARPTSTAAPIVQMRGISVEFPGVKALQEVDFRLFPGEVHALMGENGAGKSTLIKALTGVYQPNGGVTTLDAAPVQFAAPAEAQRAGISTVYQEVNLAPNLTVAENILLGREPRRFGIDSAAMRRQAVRQLANVGLDIDPGSTLSDHPIAIQQLVAITRAVAVDARVLILDEPTSSLDTDEVAELFRIMAMLRDSGVAILFVSHFLEQVYQISDRMTVLRNGRLVGEHLTKDLPRLDLIQAMLGRELSQLEETQRLASEESPDAAAEPVLSASGLGRRGSIEPFDLDLRPGEVVGIAGLLGSGRTELVRLLFGADRPDSGTLTHQGKKLNLSSPRAPIAAGIAFSSEDRKGEGILADLSVRDNLILAMQAARGWTRPVPGRLKKELVDRYLELLDIRPANPDTLVCNLSGGNQQKVLLARWLVTQPSVLILDEPTRGIDIGAKTQIQRLVAELARDGMAVIFISAELEEVVRISDRVVVLKDRQKLAELRDPSIDDIMTLIAAPAAEQSAEQSANRSASSEPKVAVR